LSRKTRTSTEETLAILVVPRSEARYLDEALALAETAGYRVVSVVTVRGRGRLGKGAIEKVAAEADKAGAGTVILYFDPPPTTVYLIQKETRRRVIDRVMLILEIFSLHAGSREAKLQIEAAVIRHRIPIIREYVRRAKMGEDPGFLGPGEYAIDRYRASLEKKLARIRRELEDLRRRRISRLERRRAGGMAHVAIVGYASAGKTSIFNAVTGEDRPVGEEYFTTLHPKHKAITRAGLKLVLVDTVGFIRRIPPEIVEAFHSTLEEIVYSDVIVFVVDVSQPLPDLEEKIRAGLETLADLGVTGLEDKLVVAANKIDLARSDYQARVKEVERIVEETLGAPVPVVPVSAATREGLDELLGEVVERVARRTASLGALR